MPETTQQRYSRELNANQNARLARSNALFAKQQQAFLKQHTTYGNQQAINAQHTATVGSAPVAFFLLVMFGFPVLIAVLIASRVRHKYRQQTSSMKKPAAHLYRAAPSLLTPTEAHFYQTLREAVGPLAVIQCKVRLADLLVAPSNDFAAFRRVSQKHVDFVLCEHHTLKPLVAVELDDRSHNRANRISRDNFVNAAYDSADFPLVHVPVDTNYNSADILAKFQKFLV